MKLKKTFSWLGILIILTSALLIVPTATALAIWDITFSKTTVAVGETITFTGMNFTVAPSQVIIYFSNENTAVQGQTIGTHVINYSTVASLGATATGTISGSITIPTKLATNNAPVTAGTYTLYVCESGAPATIVRTYSLTIQPNATLNAASPLSGAPGTTVTLTGSNFTPNAAITITFEGVVVTPLTGSTTSSAGVLNATFNVPYQAAGAHSITVSDGTSSKTTTFSITPYIVLDKQSGPAGTEVTIAGNGFGAVKAVTMYFNNQQIATTLTSTTGAVDPTKVTIPDLGLAAGTYDIKVADSSSNLGTAPFQLTVPTQPTPTQTPTVTPASIQVTTSGTNVAIQGSNFTANAAISITIEGEEVSSATASAAGSFAVQFEVPANLSAGDHIISVTDGTKTKEYTYTKEATPTPTATPNINVLTAGTNIALSGTGFLPNAEITITMDDEQIGTGITANAAGVFAAQFQVAANLSGGDHIISVTDGTNTEEYTYTVESTPPDIPVPTSPEMGATPKKPFTFEWTSVTDETTPVTYDIQIASGASFSASTILVDKTGLTLPAYTLTEAEQAELAGRAEPYFWHVRAVDGAANESPWTGAVEVNVSAPASFPRWLIYTLAGVGAVIIFGVGYLVGRRTAFYY